MKSIRSEYIDNYNKKNYDVIHLKVPKGYKLKLKQQSGLKGLSMSAQVCRWIDKIK